MYYLLGASELAFAALCFYGRALTDARVRRVIALTCIVFRAASGVASVLAILEGISAVVRRNGELRFVIVVLFWIYGFGASSNAPAV